jgi:hypothetical protein
LLALQAETEAEVALVPEAELVEAVAITFTVQATHEMQVGNPN